MEQHTEPEELADVYFKFREIKTYQGPLEPKHPDYERCAYNMLLEWENGNVTYERLSELAADDPVSCAEFGKKHGLLETSKVCQYLQKAHQSSQKIQDMPCQSIHQISVWI